ncbi:MAG: DnaJ domain-containing protein, partial [Nitrososphaera sp.]
MTDGKGYYATLGVPEKASYHEIKRTYRKLARKYHPDRNRSGHAEEMIKMINAAFEVLSDSDKRSEYDKTGFAAIYEPEPEPDIHIDIPDPAKPEQETVFADFVGGPYSLDTPKG